MKELYYPFSAFVMSLACLCLGLFVLFRNRQSKVHRTFFLLNLGISQWSFFYFLMLIANTHDFALLAARWLHLGAVFIPVFFSHFVISFLEIFSKRKFVLAFEYIFASVIALLLPTTLIVEDVAPKMFFQFWPVPGNLYPLYLLCFFGAVVHGHMEMICQYKRVDEARKTQIKYIIMAFVSGFSFGSTTYPLFYDIQIPPIGTPFVILTPTIIAYAILRHKLMGIDLFLKMTLVFIVFVTLIIYPSFFIVRWLLDISLPKNLMAAIIVLFSLILTVALFKLKVRADLTVEQLLFKGRVKLRKGLIDLSSRLITQLKLEDIGKIIVGQLHEALDFKLVSLIIFDQKGKGENTIFNSDGGVDIPGWNEILDKKWREILKNLKRVFVLEKVLLSEVDADQNYLRKKMSELGLKLCLPLAGRTGLSGVLFCGRQGVDLDYTKKDIELFEEFRVHLSVAIDNALAYEVIHELNKNLAQKVKDRTNDLEKAYNELKSTQSQLLHSAKLASIGELAAGVAHELNNSLNAAVMGNMRIKMLMEESQNNPELARQLESIKVGVRLLNNGIGRAHEVVKNLLTFSKKNSEGFQYQDIHEGLKSTLLILSNEFKDRITVHTEFCNHGEVRCDLHQLNQVFLNLLKNASDAIKQKGNIWIKTEARENDFIISISDDGAGIAEDKIDKIFDPFFTTKPVGKGTGLGLSISYNIVKSHGGLIECKSKVGKGTTFIITLPTQLKKEEAGYERTDRKAV